MKTTIKLFLISTMLVAALIISCDRAQVRETQKEIVANLSAPAPVAEYKERDASTNPNGLAGFIAANSTHMHGAVQILTVLFLLPLLLKT
jgi:hypothetical protein